MKEHALKSFSMCSSQPGLFVSVIVSLLMVLLAFNVSESVAQDSRIPPEKKKDGAVKSESSENKPPSAKKESSGTPSRGGKANTSGNVEIQEEVRAAFRVEPVVHRFDARPGELIPFEFEITSQEGDSNIEIQAVAMKQEETGVLMPDVDSPAPKAVTIEGPTVMTLKSDEPYKLKASVRVPGGNATFRSFGLLVTDKGTDPKKIANENVAKPQFGVSFVTRYLLRCDINIPGGRAADAHKIVIEQGALREQDGRPQARLYISNPSGSPVEVEMKAKLVSVSGQIVGKEFNLVAPSRTGLSAPERFVSKLMPDARIRMEEFIPFAVFSGDYQLEASVLVNGRKVVTQQFPVSASEQDYPAQAAAVAQIIPGVSASPAQAELSLQRGGERFVSIVVANQSTENYKVKAAPVNRDKSSADWFIVRPGEFALPKGTTRKVLVSMPPSRDPDAPHQYGHLMFSLANDAGDDRGHGTIDIGLIGRNVTNPSLNIGNLGWDGASSPPAIVLPLTNKGTVHFPLNARMTISNTEGSRIRSLAGYDRWLLPGDTSELRFRLKDPIPAGRYTMKIQVDTGEGLNPIEITTPIELTK